MFIYNTVVLPEWCEIVSRRMTSIAREQLLIVLGSMTPTAEPPFCDPHWSGISRLGLDPAGAKLLGSHAGRRANERHLMREEPMHTDKLFWVQFVCNRVHPWLMIVAAFFVP